MSVNIPSFYVQQFATNLQLLLQQKGSKLRGKVMEGSHVGEQASPVDQVGAVNMQPVTGRFQPMGRVDAAVDRRWVFPSDFDLPQMIDNFDKLRLLTDPQSVYVQNAVMAAGRQIDDLIINAFSGTNKTGKSGSTSTVFDTNNVVAENFASSGDTNLTVAKLREARRILMTNQVDFESDPITVIVNAKAHDSLLAEAQVISLDYNDRPVLVDGKIDRFLGMDFVYCERLILGDADDRIIPVFAKSGMYLGLWNDIQTSIDKRTDVQGIPWQTYVKLTAGATRLEEGKCVQILCEE